MSEKSEDVAGFNIENLSKRARVLSQEEFNNLHDEWTLNDCEESYLEMLINNLPLVHKLCIGRVNVNNVKKDDLIQSGVMGLMKAIEKFEPEQGWAFSTYAVPWINDYINREIDNTGNAIRIPIARLKEARKYFSILQKLPYEKQNAQEIFKVLNKENWDGVSNLSIKRIENSLGTVQNLKCLSIDKKFDSEENAASYKEKRNSILEQVYAVEVQSDENRLMKEEILTSIFSVLEKLKEREKEIIVLRFGLNGTPAQTLKQVGDKFGMTHERIRQIEKESLEKLKKHFKRIGVDSVLDVFNFDD